MVCIIDQHQVLINIGSLLLLAPGLDDFAAQHGIILIIIIITIITTNHHRQPLTPTTTLIMCRTSPSQLNSHAQSHTRPHTSLHTCPLLTPSASRASKPPPLQQQHAGQTTGDSSKDN